MHYEPDGSPFLWHFTNKCRINLPSFIPTRTGSTSLELVPISADKEIVSSGSEEVSCAEQGVQTETETVSLNPFLMNSDKMSVSSGQVQVPLVDQSVQTHFSDSSTPDALFASQSDISERGSWTDDDGDDDQWQDYDSDTFVDKKERDKQEEIAFQKQLLAIKSRARPLTDEENQRLEDRVTTTLKQLRDSQQPSKSNGSVATTRADCASEITSQSLSRGSPESSLGILPSCSTDHRIQKNLT